MKKDPMERRKQSIAFVCSFLVSLFLGFYQKNPQQWYQSRFKLFEGVQEVEGRISFAATTS